MNNFILAQQRKELVEHLAYEYLSVLAILYGEHIESGVRRIADYRNMTMLEAENELRIRMMLMKGQRLRKKRQLKEEHDEAEQMMLDQLRKTAPQQ